MKTVEPSARARGRGMAIAVTALALFAAGAATAGERETLRATVTYHDLDVRKPADARRLLQRIEFAAWRVCGEESLVDLAQWDNIRRCRVAAIDRAVREADIPTLNALALPHAKPMNLADR